MLLSFFSAASLFFDFLWTCLWAKTNRRYFYLVLSSPLSLSKKTQNKMAYVCVLIRTQAKILKTRYATSVVDTTITLQDLFCKFASGEFDEGGKKIDIRTTQVRNANSFILSWYYKNILCHEIFMISTWNDYHRSKLITSQFDLQLLY